MTPSNFQLVRPQQTQFQQHHPQWIRPQQTLLPMAQKIVHQAKNIGFRFRPGTHIIAVQHVVPDSFHLFAGMIALGVPPQNIYVLGKEYSNVPKVAAKMRAAGIQVIPTTDPEIGAYYPTFEQDIRLLWQTFLRDVRHRTVDEIVVIGDGGMVMGATPPEILAQYPIVGEEQTRSGLFYFERNPLPFDVVSEASAAVKLIFESPLFTKAVLNRVMERYRDLRGKRCGIVGMGAMGRSLARELYKQGNQVWTYDLDAQSFPNEVEGIRFDSLEALLANCDYLFGCTGRDIFKEWQWPFAHRDGIRFASVSSGDREFLTLINHIKDTDSYDFDAQSGDIEYESPSGTLHILQRGFPINFNGKEGSASQEIMQLTMGMLLGGAIQATLHLRQQKNLLSGSSQILMHSPALQRWVLSTWLQMVDGVHEFYSSALLDTCQSESWFIENSDGILLDDSVMAAMFREELSEENWWTRRNASTNSSIRTGLLT